MVQLYDSTEQKGLWRGGINTCNRMPSEMKQLKALNYVQAQHLSQASKNSLYKATEEGTSA